MRLRCRTPNHQPARRNQNTRLNTYVAAEFLTPPKIQKTVSMRLPSVASRQAPQFGSNKTMRFLLLLWRWRTSVLKRTRNKSKGPTWLCARGICSIPESGYVSAFSCVSLKRNTTHKKGYVGLRCAASPPSTTIRM